MITDMRIFNFKSIRKIEEFELKPLTILTGVNSSGKSNIMEAISFFAQASRAVLSQRRGTSNFNNVFLQGDQKQYPRPIENFVVYKKNPRNIVTFEIHINTNKEFQKIIDNISSRNIDAIKYLSLDTQISKVKNVGYSYSFRISDQSYVQSIFINKVPVYKISYDPQQGPKIIIPKEFDGFTPVRSTDTILDFNVFRITQLHPVFDVIVNVASEIINFIKEKTSRIYFISGERGSIIPEKIIGDRRTEIIPTWIGYNSEHLIEVLSHCMVRETEKFEKIQLWAKKFQLMNITAGRTLTNRLESNFTDDVFNITLNSTLSGLGSRQLLSIITQIFWSEPDDIILIEEPEISLHPENQVLLHKLFAEAVSEGKQIICSTHSPFFVLALSKTIKEKLLEIKDIVVYQVEKNKKGTNLNKLTLNESGFIQGGVPSFMKVESDLYQEWLSSLEEENEE